MTNYANDIMFADSGSDVLNSPSVSKVKVVENGCNCGQCPIKDPNSNQAFPRNFGGAILSDLQQSVSASDKRCSCIGCKPSQPVRSISQTDENTSSGIVFCDICKKQKISVSNFRALQIANSLNMADSKTRNNEANHNDSPLFEDELCKRIDLSLNMDSEIDRRIRSAYSVTGLHGTREENERRIPSKKSHNRHSSDSAFDRNHSNGESAKNSACIDLSQFCTCELDGDLKEKEKVRRKTVSSSVDEIFNLSDAGTAGSRASNPAEIHGRGRERLEGSGQRQRSLSDSQRDKAKTESNGEFVF